MATKDELEKELTNVRQQLSQTQQELAQARQQHAEALTQVSLAKHSRDTLERAHAAFVSVI